MPFCPQCKDEYDTTATTCCECEVALVEDFAVSGQRVVVTAGVPFGTPGATNILRIAWVGQ